MEGEEKGLVVAAVVIEGRRRDDGEGPQTPTLKHFTASISEGPLLC